jgi:hypothetical protein
MEFTMQETTSKPNKHEEKVVTIIVNARQRNVPKGEITYAAVVDLAFPNEPDRDYTVTYQRGEGNKPEGTLPAGGVTRVKEGMIFEVTPTNKS